MYLSTDQYAIHYPTAAHPSWTIATLHEPGSGECNEDVLLQTGGLCGVFDGATSLENYRDDTGSTGGLRAATIAATTFQACGDSLPQAAATANRLIREAQEHCRIPLQQRHRLWSTSLAVIRLNATSFDYCFTGDCMILLLHHDGGHTLLSPELDIDGETLRLWQDAPAAARSIHTHLADQIVKVRLEMNISYGVLNGEPAALDFLRHGRCSLDGIADILLFSDGLAMPKADPEGPSDWRSFAALYRCGGLPALRDHVRALQLTDPGCRRYPRFKMHDDIAAVAVTLDRDPVRPAHTPQRSSRIPSPSPTGR